MTAPGYLTGGLDTAALATAEHRSAWAAHVVDNHGALGIDYRPAELAPSFRGRTVVQRCGDVQLVEFWSDPIVYDRGDHAVDRDGDDGLRVLLPLEGALRVGRRGVLQDLRPGTAAAVSMERGFRIEQDERARAFVLTLPRALWPGPAPTTPAAWELDDGSGAVFGALVAQVAAQRDQLDADAFLRACQAAALVLPRAGAAHEDPLSSARAVVRAHADDPGFDPAALAARLGWSLRTVQQDLHRAGTSPAALIREIRLERAASRLRESPARSIASIAHASGFGSLTTFNTAYRARFGETPSRTRERGRS